MTVESCGLHSVGRGCPPGMGSPGFHPSTAETRAAQGHPPLHGEFKSSLGHMRPCLRGKPYGQMSPWQADFSVCVAASGTLVLSKGQAPHPSSQLCTKRTSLLKLGNLPVPVALGNPGLTASFSPFLHCSV